MVAFLTPGWLAALDAAAGADEDLAAATRDLDLVVEQRVDEVTFHVVFDRGRVRVVPGPADAPTIRFAQDRATAEAIASGAGSAQEAFMTGRLRVGGDLRALVDHQGALAALRDVFAGVRAATDPAGPGPDGAG